MAKNDSVIDGLFQGVLWGQIIGVIAGIGICMLAAKILPQSGYARRY